MKVSALALFALSLFLAPLASAKDLPPALRRSVVKIFTTLQKPMYLQPWQMNPQEAVTGSGAIIEGGRILTNAHVVSDQTYVQVRKAGDPVKYTARVEFVGHDAELAVLRVDDPDFYEDVRPLKLGKLPRQRDRVAVYGFPAGGDELSITEGTVSRLEVTRYTHTGNELLAIQTDAAINPGNSGGPAIDDGKVVGVSFQSYSGSGLENTGYIVPVTLITRFLADIKDGRYEAIPSLGAGTQKMENEAMRRRYGLGEDQTGVLVNKVLPGSSAFGLIHEGDVITAIDGHDIANDRTYEYEDGLRLDYSHLIAMHQQGETARVEVLRAGKPVTVPVKLRAYVDLVDGPFYDHKPTYFVYAGLVFEPLTRNYINNWDPKDQPTMFKYLQEFALLSDKMTEPVVLNYVIPDEVTEGYTDMRNVLIERVNGRNISRMADLVEAFKHPVNGFQVIEADSVSEFGTKIVLDAAKADRANAEILQRHGIPVDRSADLREPITSVAPKLEASGN
jgi:S1-C subfamily serine protease